MDELQEFGTKLFHNPLVGVLCILMISDIVSGWMVAAVKKELNSTVGMVGMTRKVYMLMLVGVAFVIEPHADGMPLTKLVAACFIANELVSLIENAGDLGVPIPKALKDMLSRFKDQDEVEITVQKQIIKGHKRPSDVVELP